MKIGEYVYDKKLALYGIYVKDIANNTYKIYAKYQDKNSGLYKYNYFVYNKLEPVKMTRKLFPVYEEIYKKCLLNFHDRKQLYNTKISQIDYAMDRIKEFYKIYADSLLEQLKIDLSQKYLEVDNLEFGKSYFCIFSFKKKNMASSKTNYDSFFIVNNLGMRDVEITENKFKSSDLSLSELNHLGKDNTYIDNLPDSNPGVLSLNVFTLSNLQERVIDYLYRNEIGNRIGNLNLNASYKLNNLIIYNNASSYELLKEFFGMKDGDFIGMKLYEIGDVLESSNFAGSVQLEEFFDGEKWNIRNTNKKIKSSVIIK